VSLVFGGLVITSFLLAVLEGSLELVIITESRPIIALQARRWMDLLLRKMGDAVEKQISFVDKLPVIRILNLW